MVYKRPRLIRKAQGTPHLEVKHPNFVCGFCLNSGAAEESATGRLVGCPCGQPIVTDNRELAKRTK
jgi:hypothetical protein